MDADPEAIRRARKEAGLSQAQLGAPLLTKQAVQSIESGRVHPSHRSLSHIAERLGVSIEVLLREGATRADGRIRELQRLYEEHRYTDVLVLAGAILRTDVFDTRRRAGAHYYSGLAHYRLSVWPEAVEQLIQARECATAVPDPWLVAETFDVEAAARHELGDPSAAELAREALRRYRGLERRRSDVEARMLENLGRILYRRGEYEAAERYYDEALDVMGAVRALDSVGRIYHGLAGARRRAGDLAGAADLMRTAIQLYKVEHELPDGGEVSLAKGENDLALILIELNELDEADRLLTSALDRFSKAGVRQLRPYVLHTISQLRQKQNDIERAFSSAQESAELSRQLDLPIPLAEALQQLGDLENAAGHARRADVHYREAIQVLRAADLAERAVEFELAHQKVRRLRRAGRSEPA